MAVTSNAFYIYRTDDAPTGRVFVNNNTGLDITLHCFSDGYEISWPAGQDFQLWSQEREPYAIFFKDMKGPSQSNASGTVTIKKPWFLVRGDNNIQAVEFGGNVMSIFHKGNGNDETPIRNGSNYYSLAGMFYNDAINVFPGTLNLSKIKLPKNVPGPWFFDRMFEGCKKNINAISLPSGSLQPGCFANMYLNATGLTQSPALPAINIPANAYQNMFKGCTNLTTMPQLPATTIGESSYEGMFQGDTKLAASGIILPAETLYKNCYKNMFDGCSAISGKITINGQNLEEGSCVGMLKNTKINQISTEAVRWNDDVNATASWVAGLPNTGTFYRHRSLKKIFDESHIPLNWTLESLDPPIPRRKIGVIQTKGCVGEF